MANLIFDIEGFIKKLFCCRFSISPRISSHWTRIIKNKNNVVLLELRIYGESQYFTKFFGVIICYLLSKLYNNFLKHSFVFFRLLWVYSFKQPLRMILLIIFRYCHCSFFVYGNNLIWRNLIAKFPRQLIIPCKNSIHAS